MARHNEFGKAGEEAAKEYYIKNGYTVREQNWRCNKLELDLVVEKDSFVVFVEVKTRKSDSINPMLAIDDKKVRRIINAGKGYLKMYNLPQLSMRIDLVFVIGEEGDFRIEVLEDAIVPKLIRRRR